MTSARRPHSAFRILLPLRHQDQGVETALAAASAIAVAALHFHI